MANDWDALADLFEQARRRPRHERAAFLDEACRDQPTMRAEVDLLLAHYKAAPSFFEELGEVVPTMSALEPVALPQDAPDPYGLIGDLVGHYLVLKKLGAGGMGVLYKALDVRLERAMALKFLPPQLSLDVEARRRFFAEARAASALDHPNICTIYEVGETDRRQLYIAMKFYQGETLRAKIAQGALPPDEAVDYAAQMVRGLRRAHAQAIIHRDIKPANVMVADPAPGEEERGMVKLLDFGLAKMAGLRLTATGAVMGTITYMSPEQLRGETVDHRADLWALGVVLYEMLTGAYPFAGQFKEEVMYRVVNEDPPPPSHLNAAVPEALDRVVMRCLEKEKTQRYDTAAALQADLQAARQA